jgi:hypothetical protein
MVIMNADIPSCLDFLSDVLVGYAPKGHPSPKTVFSPNIIPISETPHGTPEGGISGETQNAIGQERHDSPGAYHLNY